MVFDALKNQIFVKAKFSVATLRLLSQIKKIQKIK